MQDWSAALVYVTVSLCSDVEFRRRDAEAEGGCIIEPRRCVMRHGR
jgi:hypothetical protein